MILPKDIADSYAIQALFSGTATEGQQLAAVKCIVEEICNTYGPQFDPESERSEAFNLGKREIGRILVGIAKINLGSIKKAEESIKRRSVPKPLVQTRGKQHG